MALLIKWCNVSVILSNFQFLKKKKDRDRKLLRLLFFLVFHIGVPPNSFHLRV